MLLRLVRMTRPTALSLAIVALAGICAGAGASAPTAKRRPPFQHFRSRPDLKPPPVTVTTRARGTAPGLIFIAPKMQVAQAGPMILDNAGQVVWFHPLNTRGVADFRVQSYRGRPVLTWWRGRAIRGVGDGYYLIYDTSYRPIATVRAGNGLAGDIHEFLITSRNTALFTVYHQIPQDLSSVGGPKQGRIFDGIVQEVDIASGKVLLEWHSFPAIGLRESYAPPPKASRGAKAAPYDYFHANSIDVDKDGNLLVSGRNTDAVYKIRRSDGKLLWRLGGKQSDFKMGPGARFAWQHDARRRPDGTITLFDNGALPKVRDHSRALVLRLDSKARTATLVRSYSHPKKLSSGFEGNVQLLPNGNVFVGWGQHPYFTEYSRSGKVLFDVQFLKTADSYRAYRFVWTGRPTDRPTLAVRASTNGQTKVFASWNGATEVARWQVLAGPDPGHLKAIVARPKAGFETAIPFLTSEPYSAAYAFVAVRALDQNGRTLATSKTIPRRT